MAETSMFDYCTGAIERLKLMINELEPALREVSLPTAHAGKYTYCTKMNAIFACCFIITIDALLGGLRIPRSETEDVSFRSSLGIFADMIQMGSNTMNAMHKPGFEMEDTVGADPGEHVEERVSSML
jgi:hypothetical protein